MSESVLVLSSGEATGWALARWRRWSVSRTPKGCGSIPDGGARERQPISVRHIDISLSPSLESMHLSLGEDLKNQMTGSKWHGIGVRKRA